MAKTKAEWQAEAEALRNDVGIIADRLLEEAVERSWCDEYGTIMHEINLRTSEPHMRRCNEGVAAGTVTIEFSELALDFEGDETREQAVERWFRDNVVSQHHAIDDAVNVYISEG